MLKENFQETIFFLLLNIKLNSSLAIVSTDLCNFVIILEERVMKKPGGARRRQQQKCEQSNIENISAHFYLGNNIMVLVAQAKGL